MEHRRPGAGLKRQKAELRQLTLDPTEAEHHERQRFAGKLHDDLQQILVATRLRLEAATGRAAPARSAVEETVDLIGRAVEITRNLAADLYPRILEHQGLPEAIEWLSCPEFENAAGPGSNPAVNPSQPVQERIPEFAGVFFGQRVQPYRLRSHPSVSPANRRAAGRVAGTP